MEEPQELTLEDYLGILKRRKWQLILPIVLLVPIAVVVALTLPPVYRSTATILIEQQEIPPDLIRTTVTSFADQRIQVIKQRVMTTANLGAIIEEYGLYLDLREKVSMNAAVAEMRRNVGLEMMNANVIDPRSGRAQKATIAFSLSYDNPSPARAQKVTNELVSLFMDENIRQRREAVTEASAFLREEAERLANEIRAIEASLAEFKQQHKDTMPELFSVNRELLSRAEDQLRNTVLELRTLEEQRLYLQTQLARVDPLLGAPAGSGSGGSQTPQARLQALRADYARIQSRYGPEHPDRRQMEREMAVLERQLRSSKGSDTGTQQRALQRELARAQQRYSDEHPDVRRLERELAQLGEQGSSGGGGASSLAAPGENPVFAQFRSQLESVTREIETLRASRSDLQERIAVYQQRLKEAPTVEREYRNLTRGYDNAVAKYREIKDKELEAELAQSLEAERKAERFTLIEPPTVPDEPIEPNRPAIMMMGLVLSIGGGVGHLAVREFMDKGLRGARAVQSATGVLPLAVIPYIDVPADRRRRRRRRLALASALLLMLVVAPIGLHLFVRPLDVLWFTVLRKVQSALPAAAEALPSLGSIPWSA